MNRDLYEPQTGQTQVSATGYYVSLRTCRFALEPRPGSSSACPAGWAYTAGTVDGAEVHRGLLGDADHLELHVVDDRYFLASERTPDAQAPLAVWLIDAVSGQVGALTWRDAPTTLRSPEQALVVCDESFDRKCFGVRGPDAPDGGYQYIATDVGRPLVVDARDGTIQPLAVPEDVEAGLPVTQDGTGRIWVGTASGDDQLGLAYTDDGGATWTAVALPEVVQEMGHELARDLSYGDTLLEIAADGDRVAVTRSWVGPEERAMARGQLYISDDAGRSWMPHALLDPQGNGAHLYVLADGRLLLVWSVDSNATQALVSTGSDWAGLEQINISEMTADHDLLEDRDFNVNRNGIALSSTILDPCNAENATCSEDPDTDPQLSITLRFSTDVTNWRTIERLDN